MNKKFSVLKRGIIAFNSILFSFVLLLINPQCKNPNDWKPGDPQIPPPDPPVLYLPLADTIFIGSTGYDVKFDWEELSGYEVAYEIQTDTSPSFSTAVTHSTSSSPATFFLKRYTYKTNYYCRVRASSSAWTWYTDFSEIRHFWIMPDALH